MDSYKSILGIVKEENKKLAREIKEGKRALRILKDAGEGSTSKYKKIYFHLMDLGSEYRHRHIAYCLLRGREYEEIERKCRDDNKPNFKYIEELKERFIGDLNKVVEVV